MLSHNSLKSYGQFAPIYVLVKKLNLWRKMRFYDFRQNLPIDVRPKRSIFCNFVMKKKNRENDIGSNYKL
jgi:hypothetical protein